MKTPRQRPGGPLGFLTGSDVFLIYKLTIKCHDI